MTKSELKELINECISEVLQENNDTDSIVTVYEDSLDVLNEAGENRKEIQKKVLKVLKDAMVSNGLRDVSLRCAMLSSTNKAFLKGTGKVIKVEISSREANWASATNSASYRHVDKANEAIKDAARVVKEDNNEIKEKIKSATGVSVSSVTIEKGKLGNVDIVVTMNI